MIFVTAITEDIVVKGYEKKRKAGQFYEEYKYLLKSLQTVYPDATPMLFILQGKYNRAELEALHEKLEVVDYTKKYNPLLGIDTNYLLIIQEVYNNTDQDVVMLDTDCIVIRRFDDYCVDDIDVTVTTRGGLTWNGERHDIVFAPAIYHQNNRDAVNEYIDTLISMGAEYARVHANDWINIQASVNQLYLEGGMLDGFPSSGDLKVDTEKTGVISGVRLRVVSQFVLGYSFDVRTEEPKPETRIIHYKGHKSKRKEVYDRWAIK